MAKYTPEEQAQHRQELIEALESGKYTQGSNYLHKDNYYCCLGVACDISGLGRWSMDTGRIAFRYVVEDEVDGSTSYRLPQVVADYYGFTSQVGDLLQEEQRTWWDGSVSRAESMAGLNDFLELGFPQIAQLLRDGKVKVQ